MTRGQVDADTAAADTAASATAEAAASTETVAWDYGIGVTFTQVAICRRWGRDAGFGCSIRRRLEVLIGQSGQRMTKFVLKCLKEGDAFVGNDGTKRTGLERYKAYNNEYLKRQFQIIDICTSGPDLEVATLRRRQRP